MTLGEFIVARRTARGDSQARTAKKLGVTRAFLWGVESGRRSVGLGSTETWAKALGVTCAEFAQHVLEYKLVRAGLPYRVELVEDFCRPKKAGQ